MNTNQTNNKVLHESTYAMLVRSEEKERSLFETVVYGLFILSTMAAIWQFAQQPIDLPLSTMPNTASVTQVDRPAHS
jgi:hypothetical protein